MNLLKLINFFLLVVACHPKHPAIDVENSITFFGLNRDGDEFISTFEPNALANSCDTNGKFAVVIHGWTETCGTQHMVDLVSNLATARGGCILCMDYSNFSQTISYPQLVSQYEDILKVLVKKLKQLKNEGFQPDQGYMYGFSMGAQLAINAAIQVFQNRSLGLLDACDPAGVLFDHTARSPKDASLAAKNVQCIHTSIVAGTWTRTCHQNWLMGRCGWSQPTASILKTSHMQCPLYYNAAFKNRFAPMERPYFCPKTARSLNQWPANYQMGYDESRKDESGQVYGTLYANTYEKWPYNN